MFDDEGLLDNDDDNEDGYDDDDDDNSLLQDDNNDNENDNNDDDDEHATCEYHDDDDDVARSNKLRQSFLYQPDHQGNPPSPRPLSVSGGATTGGGSSVCASTGGASTGGKSSFSMFTSWIGASSSTTTSATATTTGHNSSGGGGIAYPAHGPGLGPGLGIASGSGLARRRPSVSSRGTARSVKSGHTRISRTDALARHSGKSISERYNDIHGDGVGDQGGGSHDDGDSMGDGYVDGVTGEDGEDEDEDDRDVVYPSSSTSRHQRRIVLESLRNRVQPVRHMLLLYLPPTSPPPLQDHHQHDTDSPHGSITHKDKGSLSTAPITTTPSSSTNYPTSSHAPHHPSSATPTTASTSTPNSLLSSFAAMAGSWLGAHFTSNSAYHKQVRL